MSYYTISGTVSEETRMIIFEESTWTIAYNAVISGGGNYLATPLEAGLKTVITRTANGQVKGYGKIYPTFVDEGGADTSRGVFAGGWDTSWSESNIMDYITINTTGVVTDFGDLTAARANTSAATSNGTNDRGIVMGGSATGAETNDQAQYITISTTGNATYFGDFGSTSYDRMPCSNSTNERGVSGGGSSSPTTYIDYVTINSTGNSTNFGAGLTSSRGSGGGCSNATNERGVFMAGALTNVIDYITINSTGTCTDFGDILQSWQNYSIGTDNGTNERGVLGGGNDTSDGNMVQYITINSAGNSIDLCDLLAAQTSLGATSSRTYERGVFAGGDKTGTPSNVIQYITINSSNNAQDFGDLTEGRASLGGMSNA